MSRKSRKPASIVRIIRTSGMIDSKDYPVVAFDVFEFGRVDDAAKALAGTVACPDPGQSYLWQWVVDEIVVSWGRIEINDFWSSDLPETMSYDNVIDMIENGTVVVLGTIGSVAATVIEYQGTVYQEMFGPGGWFYQRLDPRKAEIAKSRMS